MITFIHYPFPLFFYLRNPNPKTVHLYINLPTLTTSLTCAYDSSSDTVSASILTDKDPDLTFGVEDLRAALRLPSYPSYAPFPLGNEHEEVIKVLNYIPDEKNKSPGTLLRKQMGGIWNFLFAHIIMCLSRKTGGHDQSPSYITQLAHAIIFQRKIDFATYFFNELISVITPPKRPQVAFPRFISLIVNHMMKDVLSANRRSADPFVTYDLLSPIVGKTTLNKAPIPTDRPLRKGMISFVNTPNLEWGDAEVPNFVHPKVVSASPTLVAPFSHTSRMTSEGAKKKIKLRAPGTSALSSMTLPPNDPSVVTQVKPPSLKRSHSSSPPKSPPKRLRKLSKAKTSPPVTDSQKSGTVEIPLSGPKGSASKPTDFSIVQRTIVDKTETHTIPSSTYSLVDEDDLDIPLVQGSDFTLHSLSPDHILVDKSAQPGDVSTLPKAGTDGMTLFLADLFRDTTTQVSPSSPPIITEKVPSPKSSPVHRTPSPQKRPSLVDISSRSTSSESSTDDSSPSYPNYAYDSILQHAAADVNDHRSLPHCPPTPTSFVRPEVHPPPPSNADLLGALQASQSAASSHTEAINNLQSRLTAQETLLSSLLSSLGSLHQKFDNLPKALSHDYEVDLGDHVFADSDHQMLLSLAKSIGHLLAHFGLPSSSAAEGEKALSEGEKQLDTDLSSHRSEEEPIKEGTGERAEGEQPSSAEVDNKGKGKLSAEEIAKAEKKEREKAKYGERRADADSLLKLKTTTEVINPDLGLPLSEVQHLTEVQRAFDADKELSLKAAEEEALNAEVSDPLLSQASELNLLEASASAAAEEKAKDVRWYKKVLLHRASKSKIVSAKVGTLKSSKSDHRLILN